MGATFQLGAMLGVRRCGGIENTSLISLTSEERRARPHMARAIAGRACGRQAAGLRVVFFCPTRGLRPKHTDELCSRLLSRTQRAMVRGASTWSIAMPSSDSGSRALRNKIGAPLSVAPPSTITQRRADRTRGRCDRSTPASVSFGHSATARFSPTMIKCESSTGDCTAISRQFAQSSPSIQGSISSRRGQLRPPTISSQWRNTRQTSRRSSRIL